MMKESERKALSSWPSNAHSLRFVCDHIAPSTKLLEVGCGHGHLAKKLIEEGYDVVAVDSDQSAVDHARELGVNACFERWPADVGKDFGVVLFSRSLHHMPNITDAVAAAFQCLGSGGHILVEDFAFDAINSASLQWFADQIRAGEQQMFFQAHRDPLLVDLLRFPDRLAVWLADHGNHIHAFDQIQQAVESVANSVSIREVPYLYRYLEAVCDESFRAELWLQEVFVDEQRQAATGQLTLIGRRLVAEIEAY